MRNDTRLDRSLQLERKLNLRLGTCKQGDWLMHYRIWLDLNGVPAEEDGYPTPQAYEDHHINLFVKSIKEAT